MEMNVSQFTTSPANCSALYSVKWYCSSFYNLVSFFLRKIQFSQNTVLLRILQFTQNTRKVRKCFAKDNSEYYAKYSKEAKDLRKIQEVLLRKIQCSLKIVAQNTGPDVAFTLRKLQLLRKLQ